MRQQRPPVYMPVRDIIVGDKIVHENKVWEVGHIELDEGSLIPQLHLWSVGEVHGKEPPALFYPMCDSTPVRVYEAKTATVFRFKQEDS